MKFLWMARQHMLTFPEELNKPNQRALNVEEETISNLEILRRNLCGSFYVFSM